MLDGDTVKVKGLNASLRLLAIDTEETFKHDYERQAYASKTFEQYKRDLRGKSPRPVKMPTPLGDEGKAFAQRFFDGVTEVRLERDHPGEIRDFYGRYLAYVFAKKNGEWVNYNLEAVKAGMAPYFTKYGRSRRFHEEFLLAQKNAREQKLGIWNPEAKGYGDYDERLAWWNAREAEIFQFETAAESHDNYVALTRFNSMDELGRMVGKEVVLLAAVSEVKNRPRGPSVVRLARTRISGFDVVFFDKDVLARSKIAECVGEYVQVRGRVKAYAGPKKNLPPRLQLVVSRVEQVTVPNSRLKGAEDPELALSPEEKAAVEKQDALYPIDESNSAVGAAEIDLDADPGTPQPEPQVH